MTYLPVNPLLEHSRSWDFNSGNLRFDGSAQFVDGRTYANVVERWNRLPEHDYMPPSPTFATAPAVILRFSATWLREVYEVRCVTLGVAQNPRSITEQLP